MTDDLFLDIRPLREADGPVTVVARVIEVARGGVDDLIEALRQGTTIYEGDGTFLVSLIELLTARELRTLGGETEPAAMTG